MDVNFSSFINHSSKKGGLGERLFRDVFSKNRGRRKESLKGKFLEKHIFPQPLAFLDMAKLVSAILTKH
jgi:hypothetical protein